MRSLAILLPTVAYVVYFCLNMILMVTAKCPKICQMHYRPICGIRFGNVTPSQCTFLNTCLLILYICKTKQKWIQMGTEACRYHEPECDEIVSYFQNNTHLITYQGVNLEEDI